MAARDRPKHARTHRHTLARAHIGKRNSCRTLLLSLFPSLLTRLLPSLLPSFLPNSLPKTSPKTSRKVFPLCFQWKNFSESFRGSFRKQTRKATWKQTRNGTRKRDKWVRGHTPLRDSKTMLNEGQTELSNRIFLRSFSKENIRFLGTVSFAHEILS